MNPALSEIDTPTLVLDLDAMERNLARMAGFAHRHGLRWRPHAKMHKCSEIAQLQLRAGGVGVCVQKTAEAEVMAAGGVDDILITNQVVAAPKLDRVACLAAALQRRGGRLGLTVDSVVGFEALASALERHQAAPEGEWLDVYVEVDVGGQRCGLAPAQAPALAQRIVRHPQMRWAGLQAYHGKAQHLRTVAQRHDAIQLAAQAVQQATQGLRTCGLEVPQVTGAGTGSMVHEAGSGAWTELQAGSFLFMDADYARNEQHPEQPAFEHALFVCAQVTGVYDAYAVCDAGHKSHAVASGLPTVLRLRGEPGFEFHNGGDEHGILRPRPGQALPAIGDQLWLIPGHCDPTCNLHDRMAGVRGGLAAGHVERWLRIDARGALS